MGTLKDLPAGVCFGVYMNDTARRKIIDPKANEIVVVAVGGISMYLVALRSCEDIYCAVKFARETLGKSHFQGYELHNAKGLIAKISRNGVQLNWQNI